MRYFAETHLDLDRQILAIRLKKTCLQLIKPMCFLLILLFTPFARIYAQKIDSLKGLLSKVHGLRQSDVLFQLAYEYIDVDNLKGLQYSSKALSVATSLGDSLRMVRAARLKSLAYRRLGKMDSSLALSVEILPIAKRHNYIKELIHILNGLTTVHLHKSFYDKALRYSLESLELRKKYGSKSEVSIALANIGIVYFKLEDLDKALDYYLRALKIKNEIHYEYDIESLLINISLCYAYKGNITEAKKFIASGISKCRQDCPLITQMNAHFASGVVFFGMLKHSEAEAQFKESFRIAKQTGNQQFKLDNLVYLAQIYQHRKDTNALIRLVSDSEEILASHVWYNQGLIQLYAELIKLHEKTGNRKKVEHYQKKYIGLRDSIYSYQFTRNLMRVEADYIERESKSKIDAQNRILLLNQDIIYKQRFVNLFMGVIAILLVVITAILIKTNRSKRIANQLLEQRVKERTMELELNQNLLSKSLEQSNIQMERISVDVKRTLATIKGLCLLGIKDVEKQGTTLYMTKIDTISDQLLTIVNRFVNN